MSEINFSFKPTPDVIDQTLHARIAAIDEVNLAQVSSERIATMLDIGSVLGGSAVAEALDSTHTWTTREMAEKAQTFLQLGEALLGREVEFQSYGVHMPGYLAALNKYNKAMLPKSSLLMGALTPQTVIEYAVCTKHVFPNIGLDVMDIDGLLTPNACEAVGAKFKEGSATNIPLPPKSVDIIQSHYLLDQIVDMRDDMNSYHAKKNKFFQEASTSLTEKGLLLLVEPYLPRALLSASPNLDSRKLDRLMTIHKDNIKQSLYQAGFSYVAISKPESFRIRRDLEKILLENSWNISPRVATIDGYSIIIEAMK